MQHIPLVNFCLQVLRNVLEYLSIQDLCCCRLVCKLWNIEAGAYVRRKHRIVFSPNCMEKMVNFTAFVKAQLREDDDDYEDGSNKEDEDWHDSGDELRRQRSDQKEYQGNKDNGRSIVPSLNRSRSRHLPPYSDFSFTAQYPRINFSRPIVRDFSYAYGHYVRKLEIFYPNDSSLAAKDFRQFFLQGMPNVQYIHFVNLPTKLTQSSFLRRTSVQTTPSVNNNTRTNSHLFTVNHAKHNTTPKGNNNNNGSGSNCSRIRLDLDGGRSQEANGNYSDPASNSVSSNDSDRSNQIMMISNNNNEKDNLTTNCNTKDNEPVIVEESRRRRSVEEQQQTVVKRAHPDCLLKWASLTHLKIDRTLLIEVAWSESFLEDLFSVMPNLKHYELWTWNSAEGDGHSNPYFTCLTPTQRENLISLCPGSVGESLLVSLADYGLSTLKKLHLAVLSGEVSVHSVELLLMNLKGTLQELQVNCSSMQDSRMIHFPRMDKLLVLHMIISVPWKNVYTLFTPSIEYHNQFPVLETLKLELAIYHDFGFIHYFFPSGASGTTSTCRTLKELDISFSGYRDEKFIGIVAKLFPNLAKLRLDGYGNRILASICLYLQNLEYFEMYLIYGFNVDDQLTGIDRKICNEIRKSQRYLDFKMDDAQVLPSMANLSSKSSVNPFPQTD